MLIIPPGIEYSPFEKLVYPFQKAIWCSLIAIVVLSLFIMALYKYCAVRDEMFGRHSKISFIDVVTIIVGGSQKNIPELNHMRLVLATFLIFSLVTRGLYQGALFQFMQTDKRHSEVQSIDEMIAKDFHFYMYPSYQEHFKDMKFFSRQVAS